MIYNQKKKTQTKILNKTHLVRIISERPSIIQLLILNKLIVFETWQFIFFTATSKVFEKYVSSTTAMFLGAIRCFQHLCIKYILTSNDEPGAWVLCVIKCVLLTVRTPGPMKNIKKRLCKKTKNKTTHVVYYNIAFMLFWQISTSCNLCTYKLVYITNLLIIQFVVITNRKR